MGTRFRLFLILVGAALVVLTWTYPIWRPEPSVDIRDDGFPGLASELQSRYVELPPELQRIYLQMNAQNAMRAINMLNAHLTPTEPLPEEEAAPPPLENAVLAVSGELGPPELPEEPPEDMVLPPFNDLYADTSGQVAIYQYPDNSRVLRIEDLEIINGPDLWVAISPNPYPLVGNLADLGNTYIAIAPLKTNIGSQNYFNVPDANNVNLNDYESLVIFDRSNQVIFGVARLE